MVTVKEAHVVNYSSFVISLFAHYCVWLVQSIVSHSFVCFLFRRGYLGICVCVSGTPATHLSLC